MVRELAFVTGDDNQAGLVEEFRQGVGEALADPVVFGAIRGVFKGQDHHDVGGRILRPHR
jgi:hypothetical protein